MIRSDDPNELPLLIARAKLQVGICIQTLYLKLVLIYFANSKQ